MYSSLLCCFKKATFSLRNVLDKAVINFTRWQPLSTCHLYWNGRYSMNFCYKSKYDHCLKEQALEKLFWVVNFFMEHVFTFKECQTNYGYSHLANFFTRQKFTQQTFSFCLKWTSEAVTSRKISHSMLLPVIKFKFSNINQNLENFKHKLEFGKFVSGSISFMAFQHLKLFPMRLVVILTKLIYLILYNETCQYSEKMCITQWTGIS